MSAAPSTHTGTDSSSMTNQTHPDISLSLGNTTFSTPSRPLPVLAGNSLRIPSTSSRATATTNPSSAPLSTPSPPTSGSSAGILPRKRTDDGTTPLSSRLSNMLLGTNDKDYDGTNVGLDEGQSGGVDILGTPGEKRLRQTGTDAALREKRSMVDGSKTARPGAGPGNKAVTLTLRDQEKHIDNLKKENFAIKLRVHFLEERLAQLAPDHMDAALKQNISLKIEVQQRGIEMKKLKKLVLELERELERLQHGGGASSSHRERELEELLEEREREIRELRETLRSHRQRQNGDYEGHQGELLREAETRNSELEEQLENARGLLEENMEEFERLREMVERQGSVSDEGGFSDDRLKRRLENLEAENEDLKARLQDNVELLVRKEEEKEDLADENDTLRLEVEDLQRKREADLAERSQSRAAMLQEREEWEAVEEDLNALKDKLAAAMIELQQKEDELELRNKELEDMMKEHQRIVKVVEDEWRGEVEEARGQVEELKDVLAERESESRDLRMNITELETNTNDLHSKFEAALTQLENEIDQKEVDIESLNETIQKLGQQIYVLEDENDRLKEDAERVREEEAIERERLEGLTTALKDKSAGLKSQLQKTTDAYETCTQEIYEHRARQEELARHVEELVKTLEAEREARERVESELSSTRREHEGNIRQERRITETKEKALRNTLNDVARLESLLSQRNHDLEQVQSSLKALEQESRSLGESHTTARHSLQLELDRAKNDLERLKEEVARARKDLDEKDNKLREKEERIDDLHAENRDLASQLASQMQAKLNASEKLDSVQATLKVVENELANARARVGELEGRLIKDQRELLSAETQYRDQLTERNTLLLTIYQYMDKILGVDKTPKKGGQAETKPFTNFGVFHDNLITRLKALSQIQLDFDKRVKEAEVRFNDRLIEMRKQLDHRWKQIDKFETSLKTFSETKVQWRRKVNTKEAEIEALKTTNNELTTQISSMKRPVAADTMELRSLSVRAANAERRLINAQNQLLALEQKIALMNERSSAADQKWEARVKEYESQIKLAEERVKRERQGAKERTAELESHIKRLQQQLDIARKRVQQLDIIDSNKADSGTPSR
ncbi:hypothetical protein AMATHDRAFT_1175 [Amanita thiersii Skay4041]|uniref:Centrosomin N-terminal motif 1 domain-containing protein n=1 Tax=Amanita thiersii Skay4041 TaxID=703135 RepID=A0A2A9NZJ6_9AGAR|nr:hypothetical protein AMATHDRAFT_1175 [Amanita thiersii Skay4041]